MCTDTRSSFRMCMQRHVDSSNANAKHMAALTPITSSMGTHGPTMKHGHSWSSVGTQCPAMKHGRSWQEKAAVPLKYKAFDSYNNDGKPIKKHAARDLRPTRLPIPPYLRRHRVGRIHHMPLDGFAVVFGVWDVFLSAVLSNQPRRHNDLATARSPGAGARLHDN